MHIKFEKSAIKEGTFLADLNLNFLAYLFPNFRFSIFEVFSRTFPKSFFKPLQIY